MRGFTSRSLAKGYRNIDRGSKNHYTGTMTVTQTVEIPENRRLVIEVPPEVPTGKAVLTFSPVSGNETVYTIISNEKAVSMTSEVIEKFRPALEDLAK